MLSIYPACFFKEDNGYSVIFPDLNYLSTSGENLQEAMTMAIDCLAGYLYMCKKDNDDIPQPSDIENINLDSIKKDLEISSDSSFINMVAVDVDEYAKIHFERAVKKTLSIPVWLNNAAMEHNINFSQVLQEALINKIKTY